MPTTVILMMIVLLILPKKGGREGRREKNKKTLSKREVFKQLFLTVQRSRRRSVNISAAGLHV